MAKSNYHVTRRTSGWAVKRAGSSRAASVHTTQAAAIQAGRGLARQAKGELRIHGRDDRIREGWSYGNDPFPPVG